MYLGLDLGTSGVKAVLLAPGQGVAAVADAPLAISRPRPLWSEQDPEDWWQAVGRAVAGLRAQDARALAAVRAIGLAGQMHGAVVLDEQLRVLRPALLWNDGRAAAECAALERCLPQLRALSGNAAMPGFTAPKLLWLRRHEPELFARIRRVLLPKDWLRLRLSGELATDMSDASGTLWLDVGGRRWSPALLAACGLDEGHMPLLVEGSAPAGALRADLARDWGLPPGIPIAGGGGDNAASAVGMGAVQPGQGLVSLGTSGVVFLTCGSFLPAAGRGVHAFAHALPARWHQMAVMLSASSALRWAVQLTGQRDEAALLAQVATLDATQQAQAPLFLPYLQGERTPHNDPAASGVLVGLRAAHGPADLGYAVLEGVAFGLKDGWEAMDHAARTAPLALVGGGARSNLWAQLIASALGCPLQRHDDAAAAAALGAARLAWLADGGTEAQACPPPARGDHFAPDVGQSQRLALRYARFQALYPALQGHFASSLETTR